MAQYEVGNILLQIVSDVKNTTTNIDVVEKSLNRLKNTFSGIEKINISNVKNNLDSISKLDLSNISNAFRPLEELNEKPIKNFNSITRALNSITSLQNKNINFDKINQQVSNLTQTVEPFIAKIKEAEPALKAFSNSLNLGKVYSDMSVAQAKVEKIRSTMMSASQIEIINSNKVKKSNAQLQITENRLKKIQSQSNKTSFSFSKIFNLGKIYFWLNYTKRAGQAVANMLNSAISFNETLNKFQVSMGDYYEQSIKFVNNLTYAFNLSTESIMNYQSTFKNMLDAIGGLSPDTTYGLSETLTRMAIDYASLFNVSIDRAMEQFQSTLSGQIRSIRSVSGYDVSEASIYAIYQSLGGTKTIRQLDQIEKRLLRILAVQQQMERTGAVGDFEKTINICGSNKKLLDKLFVNASKSGVITKNYC